MTILVLLAGIVPVYAIMNIVFDPNDDGNLLITLGTLTPILGDLLMVYAFKDKYQILISNHRLQNKCYLCARYDDTCHYCMLLCHSLADSPYHRTERRFECSVF
ncbi:hypothetical protein ACIXLU_00870 [Bacteroides fragilis]|uniref:Transmembrane protein n=1 Tax=Bacteroides fragilis TaxID=817 RepID=A0AB38PQ07_BACFG|nr:hypothetical protein F9Z90_10875 [Bacteroides fragilis]TWV41100.1 hypothetical protein FSA06_13255 [Bacteroides fragilis]TWV48287.1 hypothetical protein FSA03_12770 [Bacteroides fragilis]